MNEHSPSTEEWADLFLKEVCIASSFTALGRWGVWRGGAKINLPWIFAPCMDATKQSDGCPGWNKLSSKSWCSGDPALVYTAPDTSGLQPQQWWWQWRGWSFQQWAYSEKQAQRLLLVSPVFTKYQPFQTLYVDFKKTKQYYWMYIIVCCWVIGRWLNIICMFWVAKLYKYEKLLILKSTSGVDLATIGNLQWLWLSLIHPCSHNRGSRHSVFVSHQELFLCNVYILFTAETWSACAYSIFH